MTNTRADFDFGLISTDYQRKATKCVEDFLSVFSPSPKTQHGNLHNEKQSPIKLRVNENPPSVQILELPIGGVNAGAQRIREKLTRAQNPFEKVEVTADGILVAKYENEIVIAHDEDLTRECIILTLTDSTVDIILENGLVAPRQVAEILELMRKGHPDFFVVVQRYIMGIEKKDGIKVPYKVVEQGDEETFAYLAELPGLL